MDNPNPVRDTVTQSVAGKSPSPPPIAPQQPPLPSPSSSSTQQQQLEPWKEAQDSLKRSLITEDDLQWRSESGESGFGALNYVGGVDISFSEDQSLACGTIVVLELRTLRVVYEDFLLVELRVPYVPGFLAFREAPVLLELLERMKNNASPFYPQVLMVDGNGVLHPRGFGLACHLGVLANLPTIGIGKNEHETGNSQPFGIIARLHHVDGLTLSGVKELLKTQEHHNEDFATLTGDSGQIWGAAMRSTEGSLKPIFISIGHRISLDTAVAIVKMTCKYRVPEPIRQADIRSRDYIRKHQLL